ncbi:hypothetical protein QN327_06970 [Klebsiella pneumoniae]|uniref:hypothetical protein n=1 Tax=Klebsiella pneumoniae TaxID=573 RepID=UPI001BFE8A35|nr:hypothetical protein QN327_06970 [Klebsiella pneumoniae]
MASIVLFFVYVMFFIPKMDLISLGGGFNAGLRVDDLIICLLFFFFFLYAAQNKKTKVRESANKQVISSQADSLIKISRIWADFFPANTSNQPI